VGTIARNGQVNVTFQVIVDAIPEPDQGGQGKAQQTPGQNQGQGEVTEVTLASTTANECTEGGRWFNCANMDACYSASFLWVAGNTDRIREGGWIVGGQTGLSTDACNSSAASFVWAENMSTNPTFVQASNDCACTN
jgi:hypothetical protein